MARILSISHKEILKKFGKNKKFVWIKRQIPPAEALKIKKLEIEGLGFVEESQRFYPNKELAAQMIGFVGRDAKGLEGLEFEYQNVLQGTPRYLSVNRDALGRQLFTVRDQYIGTCTGKVDITLTIDKNIQYIAEKELQLQYPYPRQKTVLLLLWIP